jgi:UDP-4-amino-4,6-dideoxy-N-acetyl-beta-L-altrosamine N-acetyltransferase
MALRKLRENDLELMLLWRNHPSIRLSMFSQSIIELEAHKLWFKDESQKKSSEWFLFIDENHTPRGIVYFTQINRDSRNAYWGFYTAPDAPSGMGTKMGQEALAYYFNNLGFHKLNAEVLSSNERSYHFHLKLGFEIEGIFQDHYLGVNGYESVIRFALIKKASFESEFKKSRVGINE